MRTGSARIICCWLTCLLGCSGQVGGGDTGGSSGGSGGPAGGGGSSDGRSDDPTPGAPDSQAACDGAPVAGPAPLRRLTQRQYNLTIQRLFNTTERPADAFVADERLEPFVANVFSSANGPMVEQYQQAAERLAGEQAPELARALNCGSEVAAQRACGQTFIASFGRRTYRRPLAAAETTSYQTIFEGARTTGGLAGGVQRVVATMLQSPHFLYHVESHAMPDAATGQARLDGGSLAGRLSFFLTGAAPDDALLDAAAAGTLNSDEGLKSEAERLLGSPAARDMMLDFYRHWFEIEKLPIASVDPGQNPGYTAALREASEAAANRFVSHVIGEKNASLSELLTGAYAIDAAGNLDRSAPDRRSGVLTQPAVLTVNPRTVQRGRMVRQLLLCQHVPAPPPEVTTDLPPAQPNESPRAQWQRHVSDPACGGCHNLMDPIGFSFDHFDEVGQWRERNRDFAIDDEGELVDAGDASGTFRGVAELGRALARSDALAQCATQQWLRYALGRELSDGEACALRTVAADFQANDTASAALLAALVTSVPFTHVTPAEAKP